MDGAKKIIVIPAKSRQEILNIKNASAKERVAAYCRVSTEQEEQESSFENQLKHFTEILTHNPRIEFVGIYADDGISGKSMKKRPEFLRMIADCKAGKIDRVITKSISRFSRNAQECVAQIRTLKELGIPVAFEKENLDTSSPGTDLILSIMSSLAEEESRSLSTNIKWTIKKKFAEGKPMFNAFYTYGFTRGEGDSLVIVEEQAIVVRRIYREFLCGKSTLMIAKGLNDDGILSPSKKGNGWTAQTILNILRNEKYKGAIILQKTFSADFLSKRVVNKGQIPMYYIENNHEPIISKETFGLVETELRRRQNVRTFSTTGIGRHVGKDSLSGKVYCGVCGARMFKDKQCHDNFRRGVWVCMNHRKYSRDCKSEPVSDELIKDCVVESIKIGLNHSKTILKTIFENIDSTINDEEFVKLSELNKVEAEFEKQLVEVNARFRNKQISDEEFFQEQDNINQSIRKTQQEITDTRMRLEDVQLKKYRIEQIQSMVGKEVFDVDDLNIAIWELVDTVNIYGKERIGVKYKDGSNITINTVLNGLLRKHYVVYWKKNQARYEALYGNNPFYDKVFSADYKKKMVLRKNGKSVESWITLIKGRYKEMVLRSKFDDIARTAEFACCGNKIRKVLISRKNSTFRFEYESGEYVVIADTKNSRTPQYDVLEKGMIS